MASNVKYSGDGADTDFTISFSYESQDYIEVYVDSVLQTRVTDWEFLSATEIRFVVAPPATAADNVEIRRNTSLTPIVNFTTGAGVLETDLDKIVNQLLDVVEELQDNFPRWEAVATYALSGTSVDIELPATPDEFRLEVRGLNNDVSADDLDLRVSIDGGSTFKFIAGNYAWSNFRFNSAGETASANSSATEIRLITNISADYDAEGDIDIFPGDGTIPGRLKSDFLYHASDGGHDAGRSLAVGGFNNGSSPALFVTRWTDIRLLWAGASVFSTGTATLYQRIN